MKSTVFFQILSVKMQKTSLKHYGVMTFGFSFAMLLLFFGFSNILPHAESEMETIYARRVLDIVKTNQNTDLTNQWRHEMSAQGTWSDLDYTAGCLARHARWPAQDHFYRIITMASEWNQKQWDTDLFGKISLALDYWFDNDFHSDDCINAGGRNEYTCPCDTPGFWNINWYCQIILIPGLVGNACLLLKSNLSTTQFGNCTNQMRRSYERIDGSTTGRKMDAFTGANLLDISSIGLSLALLTSDIDLMKDALGRCYNESQYTKGNADGIKVDGSFMQHNSQLYTGNYGQIFIRNLIKIFIQTSQTSLAPPPAVQRAFLTLIKSSEWFIYKKNDPNDPFSPILMWQNTVMGRMVSNKYEEWHGIEFEIDQLLESTSSWFNHDEFKKIVERLKSPRNNLNPGPLVGTKFFQSSDYLVHRGENYIVTLKMFSNRTTNSECHNKQNPFGLHLSDGTIYTYLNGDEYTNVYGAWDWNLIPGTTVDYGAKPLACNKLGQKGIESFVGGVAAGRAGIAVMNFTDPIDGSLHWCKTFFFFPGGYAVQFAGEVISTNKSVKVVTTLDQRQLSGPVFIEGNITTENIVRQNVRNIWHDKIGYQFLYPVDLTVNTTPRESDWAAIGISAGNETQNIFTAYFHHPKNESQHDSFSYIAHLDVSQKDFAEIVSTSGKAKEVIKVFETKESESTDSETATVVLGAAYGDVGGIGDRFVSIAFVTAGEYDTRREDIQNVSSDVPILLLFMRKANGNEWTLAVADPSQTLSEANLRVNKNTVRDMVQLKIELPDGAFVGSTTMTEFNI